MYIPTARTHSVSVFAAAVTTDELLGMVEVLRAQNWYLQTSKPVAVALEDALCPEWEAMGGYLCLDVE